MRSVMKRIVLLTSMVALLGLVGAAPVLGAAPGHDTYGAREVIATFPFSASLSTVEATTDADDAEANAKCGAPATDASVWYEYVAIADGPIVVDVSASDYSAGVIVVSGTPGTFVIETCGPDSVLFFGSTGVAYAILAFDSQEDGSGNGGTLEISVDEPPPPPEIDLVVSSGTFNPTTGSARISGTVTCTDGGATGGDIRPTDTSGKDFIDVQVSQTVGRFRVTGGGGATFDCDGTTQPWSVEIIGSTGRFSGGRADVSATAVACGSFACGEEAVNRTLTLRK
jgi:hypothetical protein